MSAAPPDASLQIQPPATATSWPLGQPNDPIPDGLRVQMHDGPHPDLDHLDDSVDNHFNQAAPADDVPLMGGRMRTPSNWIVYCLIAFSAVAMILGIIFPAISFTYTTYRLITDTYYYTPEQYAVIYAVCMQLGLWASFLLSAQRNSCIQYLSSVSIFINLAIWDLAHKGGFFNIPATNKDFLYKVSYFIFYWILIGYMVVTVLIVLVVLIVCLLYCWDQRRKARILAANSVILDRLGKTTRRDWTAKHSPAELEKERDRGLDNCCICYAPINDESFMTELPVCHHVYHHSCVMEWLKKNPKCPICRANVVSNIQLGNNTAVVN